jgi:adenine C2-methylase RlmN of 23S rRNA A2503 and tRNA A37
LSAPNDELRDKLMPINKRWNIEELFAAAKGISKISAARRAVYVRVRLCSAASTIRTSTRASWRTF